MKKNTNNNRNINEKNTDLINNISSNNYGQQVNTLNDKYDDNNFNKITTFNMSVYTNGNKTTFNNSNNTNSTFNQDENKILSSTNVKSIEELHLEIVKMMQSYNKAVKNQEVIEDIEDHQLQTVNKCEEREIM
jgi:hypothetical protein